MLPSGMRAGVPPQAAAVDAAAILDEAEGRLGQQLRHPGAVLLASAQRPEELPRPFVRVDDSYWDYVRRNCQAGLQRLVAPRAAVV